MHVFREYELPIGGQQVPGKGATVVVKETSGLMFTGTLCLTALLSYTQNPHTHTH